MSKIVNRYSHLKVRLSQEELEKFHAAAEQMGMPLSSWVRWVLRANIPGAVPKTRTGVSF